MNKTILLVIAFVATLAIGFGLGVLGSGQQGGIKGVSYDPSYLVANVYQGQGNALVATGGTLVGPTGGSSLTGLTLTTSTSLGASFLCQYSVITLSTSTASVTSTLPTATNATACLTQDGQQKETLFKIASVNAFSIVLATSTGDVLTWNGTSTAGGATLATSSAGSFWKLSAVRLSSTSIVYTVSNLGSAH